MNKKSEFFQSFIQLKSKKREMKHVILVRDKVKLRKYECVLWPSTEKLSVMWSCSVFTKSKLTDELNEKIQMNNGKEKHKRICEMQLPSSQILSFLSVDLNKCVRCTLQTKISNAGRRHWRRRLFILLFWDEKSERGMKCRWGEGKYRTESRRTIVWTDSLSLTSARDHTRRNVWSSERRKIADDG